MKLLPGVFGPRPSGRLSDCIAAARTKTGREKITDSIDPIRIPILSVCIFAGHGLELRLPPSSAPSNEGLYLTLGRNDGT